MASVSHTESTRRFFRAERQISVILSRSKGKTILFRQSLPAKHANTSPIVIYFGIIIDVEYVCYSIMCLVSK